MVRVKVKALIEESIDKKMKAETGRGLLTSILRDLAKMARGDMNSLDLTNFQARVGLLTSDCKGKDDTAPLATYCGEAAKVAASLAKRAAEEAAELISDFAELGMPMTAEKLAKAKMLASEAEELLELVAKPLRALQLLHMMRSGCTFLADKFMRRADVIACLETAKPFAACVTPLLEVVRASLAVLEALTATGEHRMHGIVSKRKLLATAAAPLPDSLREILDASLVRSQLCETLLAQR